MDKPSKLSLLLVENDNSAAQSITSIIEEFDGLSFQIQHVVDFPTLKQKIREKNFDVILLDASLPDISINELVIYLEARCRNSVLVVLDEHFNEDLALELLRLGAQEYLNKRICKKENLQRIVAYSLQRKKYKKFIRQREHQEILNKVYLTEDALNKEISLNVALLDTTEILVVMLDNTGRIVRFNKKCEELTGYTYNDVVGKFVWDFLLLPEDIEPVKNVFNSLTSGIFPNTHKNFWLTKNGDNRCIMWSNTAVLDDNGEVEHIVATGIDITEQNKIETALKERERDYRSLTENIPSIIFRTYIQPGLHSTHYFNNMVSSITGYTPDELGKGKFCGCEIFIHDEDQEKVERVLNNAITNNKPFEVDYRIKRKDGGIRYARERGRPIFDAETGKNYIDGIISDITPQKKLMYELLESERKFRDLAEKSPVGIYVIQENSFSYVNTRFSEIFGYKENEMIGMNPIERVYGNDQPAAINNMQQQLDGIAPSVHMKLRGVKKDGEIIDIDIYGSKTEYNEKPAIIGTLIDITRQKIIEHTLQEQMLRYEQILHTSMDGFLLAETSGKILDANPAFCEMLGYPYHELLELDINKIHISLEPEQPLQTIDQYTGERASVYETQYRHKNGQIIDMEVSINIMPADGKEIAAIFTRDITTRKQNENLERQRLLDLAHASRLTTMGEMATEFAHELNQPLSAISTYSDAATEIVKSEGLANEDLTEALQAISTQAYRAGDIIRSLRDFIGKEDSNPITADINELILLSLKLVKSEAHLNNVNIKFIPENNLPKITIEKILIEQVILNLARNAIEALSELDNIERTIEITTYLNKDKLIEVNVKDNGPGLPYDNPEQVFESFLTTKNTGMGMGLSISRNIIEAHGGELVADNVAPHGANFKITLPLT